MDVQVAYLGPVASYTHQATKSVFTEQEWQLAPKHEIKDVFTAVLEGTAVYGVVPFENSSFGTVKMTLDELADRAGRHRAAGVIICGEIYLEVHHCLLGRGKAPDRRTVVPAATSDEPAVPLTSLAHVRHVYSHPQALGQTRRFRDAYLAGAATEAVSSTSRAAELVAADASGTSAAVAGAAAAAEHGLDVLARHIEDQTDNMTWFLVLRRGLPAEEGEAGPPLPPGLLVSGPATGGHKSLVSFTVPHATPGSLAGVLQSFGKHGLNMTNITRVPSLARPFDSLFLVEFEGSKLQDPEGRVAGALGAVAKSAQQWRWWGSWADRKPSL
ncbi:hypothetical protein P8C59_003821 [Phyllachora maydis]|uniref:prephenate dehydratase n=1 Tax=Phyllachora maydis TaxID=1825666 RepID=A0AAD9M9Q3_9PEZI|nr:hypothetical protein P8C59_003821 [Phyllachora maydis]